MSEPNYRCVDVACVCPKCHEEITLRVYTQMLDNRTKQPTLWVELANFCGEKEAPKPIEPTFIDLDERIKEKEEE